MYSFSYLGPVCCSMSSSNCCFLTCIQVSQKAGQVNCTEIELPVFAAAKKVLDSLAHLLFWTHRSCHSPWLWSHHTSFFLTLGHTRLIQFQLISVLGLCLIGPFHSQMLTWPVQPRLSSINTSPLQPCRPANLNQPAFLPYQFYSLSSHCLLFIPST